MGYDVVSVKFSTFPAFLVSFDIIETNNDDAVFESPAFWISCLDSSVPGAPNYGPNIPGVLSNDGTSWDSFFSAIRSAITSVVEALPGTHWGTLPGDPGTYIEASIQNFHVQRYDASPATDVTPV